MQDPLSGEAFAHAYDLQQNPDAADRSLHVEFGYDEMIDDRASHGWEETRPDGSVVKHPGAGRPIFKSVEMCEIRVPGDKDNIVRDRVARMRPDPRQRFPVQYAKFKAGESSQIVGTLLREWGLITTAEAKTYEAVGIFTVEQLAALSDQNAQQFRGSLVDRQRASDFLAMAQGQAPLAEARAEAARMRQELDELHQQMKEMRGEVPVSAPAQSDDAPKKIDGRSKEARAARAAKA